jgi:hypothetical protein
LEKFCVLGVAERSRRSDLGVAWQQRWQRLTDRVGSGFCVCVVEFETPAEEFMATAHVPVSDMLVTVKSRELQRGMLAERRGD